MPTSILFTTIATIYYSTTNFDFSKAIKLGTVMGAMIGVIFSLVVAVLILILRALRIYKLKSKLTTPSLTPNTDTIKLDPTLYEKKTQTIQKEITPTKLITSNLHEEKLILLMDKRLTYLATLTLIRYNNIGKILHQDKDKCSILVQDNEEKINISITSLSKHTSEVLISSTNNTNNIKNLIFALKEKEHSFMQY